MEPLLNIAHLSVQLPTPAGTVEALRDVSLTLNRGEVLALVGESGCGKSMLCRSVMKLLPKNAVITGGSITVDGVDITAYRERDMRRLRGRVFSMIFQDPLTALDPAMPVGDQIAEAVQAHGKRLERAALERRVWELMELVGLDQPQQRWGQYPHQLSGGLRQRVMIAMALACEPSLLIADEPTTALDVTIQAQILKLMNELKKEKGTSILFITHDLGVINQMADEVAVMYCGQVVEMCKARTIFAKETTCSHPYTEGLMTSIPRLDTPVGARLEAIPGAVPHPLNLPKGCKFAPRCKYATEKCMNEEPKLELAEDNHLIRCFYPDKEARHAK